MSADPGGIPVQEEQPGAAAEAGRRRLRLCMLCEGFYPEALGGLEIHSYQLAERLLDLGVDCEVLARPIRPETPPEQRVGRITVRHLGVPGQFKGAGVAAALPLGRFVVRYGAWLARERRRFDVALALGAKTPIAPALVANLASGLPFVVASLAGGEFAQPISRESLGRPGGRLLEALLAPWQRARAMALGRAAAVIAVSAEVERGFRALGVPPGRIVRIPNGIDVERFRPALPGERAALRARLGLPADHALFLFVGRLSRAKGVLMLAAVWREIAARHADAHLVVVGDGGGSFDDCEAELRAFVADHGLGAAVTLAGASGEVPAYLRAADVFLLPSEHEGFSLALVEATAAGLPVVATAVGGAREVVGDPAHGRLVPPKDPEALRAAIEDLCACRSQWPAIGAAARAVTVARYSLDAVAARYVEVLHRATGAGFGTTPAT